MTPLVGWERLSPGFAPAARLKILCRALDLAVMARLRPCDVFIGMSGLILEAAAHARRKFGARIYLERGSRHILSQDRILREIPGAERPNAFAIARELAGYRLADRIAIASSHVSASFIEEDAALSSKLFVNPYGVDLDLFPLRKDLPQGPPTVLFVGGWTRRKGVDILAAAVERLHGVKLMHVGGIGDIAFPKHDRFVHFDSVPQWQLQHFYAQAHVFALASREEGLALVQLQALASGLPLVCTDRTGGADLARTPALASRIRVAPHGDIDALVAALREALEVGMRPEILPECDREALSWRAYGSRYARELSHESPQDQKCGNEP
jgi:glycosyltransferase involved in cell wall biosynthesis